MRTAIIGGGITGIVTALLLAERGHAVVIFDRAHDLMTRASTSNEGKIHLGYVYGADRSFATASRMIDDALLFRPILERILSFREFEDCLFDPFRYIVPASSDLPAEAICHHVRRVDDALRTRSKATGSLYISGEAPADSVFVDADDPSGALLIETQERGVWPRGIADALVRAVDAHPGIEVRTDAEVHRVREAGTRWDVILRRPVASSHGTFDTVVNAAWADRRNIDRRSGHASGEAWYTRFKFGIVLEQARAAFGGDVPVNGTGTLGSYGDSVYYPQNDTLYCSWYPVGRCFSTTGDFSLDWPDLGGTDEDLAQQTWAGYAKLDPRYGVLLDGARSCKFHLIGDYIMAKGHSDIQDPRSALHQRADHGPVQLASGYWSVETGKYGSAPRVADQVTRAILGLSA